MDRSKLSELIAYVTKADSKVVRVKVIKDTIVVDLKKLGFVFDQALSEFYLQLSNNTEKGELFSKLRGINICFSSGKEWTPAEVFQFLRENKFVSGKYQRVSWSQPNVFHIVTE
ncbi:hypothetical protein [Shewanella surugensis]|uniref:Uncharacterized protein n=1 Tax=Shewanella surugensis TaxID=212020 RepID=A0ABT0L9R6_9GAMM|nr:hypothetical protein [Shewanella surugensis]MCL1124456.1 hypothetical protein [Shewanella surugensis]